MEEKTEKTELTSKGEVNSLSKNINSAADVIMVLAISGVCIYLYNYGIIKTQETGLFGPTGDEKYEINWGAVVTGLFFLLGSVGLNYILRGVSSILKILFDIKSK
jgi:hypothetical protein